MVRKYLSGWWYTKTPLKNMSSSVGMMTFPTEWKIKIHVPNHQPVIDDGWFFMIERKNISYMLSTLSSPIATMQKDESEKTRVLFPSD